MHAPAAVAEGDCPQEDQCSFRKPVFLLILDYSASMNLTFEGGDTTRWEAAAASVKNLLAADNEFVSRNMLLGLMRFGHDPEPDAPGTSIPGDASGIVDGQAVDVVWYDEQQGYAYTPCNGAALINALNQTPPPLDGEPSGIGTWTNGALLRARALMEQSLQAHPEDAPALEDRAYLELVMTDGEWTDPAGVGQSPEHDPSTTAAAMYGDGIGDPDDPTHVSAYVVYFGDLMGAGETDANELALAGGTDAALVAEDPMALTDALQTVVQEIKDGVIQPDCVGGLPRIMVLVDGSSSMLNAGLNEHPAEKGMSGWDQARFALAGDPQGDNLSLFDQEILDDQQLPVAALEDLVHLGLAVFGNEEPD
ncbi:MAG: flagellar biosynthesis protein P, partial [Myxococcales bacterium]|nr:flagellar biosynthesis protein P [Myxococcales bacterium]